MSKENHLFTLTISPNISQKTKPSQFQSSNPNQAHQNPKLITDNNTQNQSTPFQILDQNYLNYDPSVNPNNIDLERIINISNKKTKNTIKQSSKKTKKNKIINQTEIDKEINNDLLSDSKGKISLSDLDSSLNIDKNEVDFNNVKNINTINNFTNVNNIIGGYNTNTYNQYNTCNTCNTCNNYNYNNYNSCFNDNQLSLSIKNTFDDLIKRKSQKEFQIKNQIENNKKTLLSKFFNNYNYSECTSNEYAPNNNNNNYQPQLNKKININSDQPNQNQTNNFQLNNKLLSIIYENNSNIENSKSISQHNSITIEPSDQKNLVQPNENYVSEFKNNYLILREKYQNDRKQKKSSKKSSSLYKSEDLSISNQDNILYNKAKMSNYYCDDLLNSPFSIDKNMEGKDIIDGSEQKKLFNIELSPSIIKNEYDSYSLSKSNIFYNNNNYSSNRKGQSKEFDCNCNCNCDVINIKNEFVKENNYVQDEDDCLELTITKEANIFIKGVPKKNKDGLNNDYLKIIGKVNDDRKKAKNFSIQLTAEINLNNNKLLMNNNNNNNNNNSICPSPKSNTESKGNINKNGSINEASSNIKINNNNNNNKNIMINSNIKDNSNNSHSINLSYNNTQCSSTKNTNSLNNNFVNFTFDNNTSSNNKCTCKGTCSNDCTCLNKNKLAKPKNYISLNNNFHKNIINFIKPKTNSILNNYNNDQKYLKNNNMLLKNNNSNNVNVNNEINREEIIKISNKKKKEGLSLQYNTNSNTNSSNKNFNKIKLKEIEIPSFIIGKNSHTPINKNLNKNNKYNLLENEVNVNKVIHTKASSSTGRGNSSNKNGKKTKVCLIKNYLILKKDKDKENNTLENIQNINTTNGNTKHQSSNNLNKKINKDKPRLSSKRKNSKEISYDTNNSSNSNSRNHLPLGHFNFNNMPNRKNVINFLLSNRKIYYKNEFYLKFNQSIFQKNAIMHLKNLKINCNCESNILLFIVHVEKIKSYFVFKGIYEMGNNNSKFAFKVYSTESNNININLENFDIFLVNDVSMEDVNINININNNNNDCGDNIGICRHELIKINSIPVICDKAIIVINKN